MPRGAYETYKLGFNEPGSENGLGAGADEEQRIHVFLGTGLGMTDSSGRAERAAA